MFDANGFVPPAGYRVADSAWFQRLQECPDAAFVLTGGYKDTFTEKETVMIVVPIRQNGELIGGACADLDMGVLYDLLDTIQIGASGHVIVFASNNEIVYHHDTSILHKHLNETSYSENMKTLIQKRYQHSCVQRSEF